tara:strand:+ start:5515 stop:6390 length:876 start_codon:yes stop_codon:yes gene_type:complete
MNWIQTHYKSLLIALGCFIAFVVFEAFQQLFYAENFNNGVPMDVTFLEVLKGGMLRWGLWLATSVGLVYYVRRFPIKSGYELIRKLLAYGGLLLLVLLLDIALAALVNMPADEKSWSVFTELFQFYFFHKAPIVFVFLVVVILLVHFFQYKSEIEVYVQELGDLKNTNSKLYKQIKSTESNVMDTAKVIQVRVGNRSQIVPLEHIVWIEADDYCVKIHDQKGKAYTLRNSLKSLEEKLPSDYFQRIHRRSIVNLKFIERIEWGASASVTMRNGLELPLAQSRIKSVKAAMN